METLDQRLFNALLDLRFAAERYITTNTNKAHLVVSVNNTNKIINEKIKKGE